MLEKIQVLQRISQSGIVAVVRAETSQMALDIAEAVRLGGVEAIEITFTVPGAVKVLEDLASKYKKGEILLGAGTVMDAATARLALLSGAQFVVCPNLDPEVIRLCNKYGKVCVPGAMTVSEMVTAMELGADVVKLFPATTFGPKFIRDVRGPLPHVSILPTGGINIDNAAEWISAGAVAIGVGGELTGGAKKGDYGLVTETARKFVAKVQEGRQK